MTKKLLTSTQNSFIKQLFQLKEKSRERKKRKQFLIEGYREISLAIKGNYTIESLLFYSEICSEGVLIDVLVCKYDERMQELSVFLKD